MRLLPVAYIPSAFRMGFKTKVRHHATGIIAHLIKWDTHDIPFVCIAAPSAKVERAVVVDDIAGNDGRPVGAGPVTDEILQGPFDGLG